MIKVMQYKDRESALDQLLELDRDYALVRHDFPRGEVIEAHTHPVDEWVIFNRGRCEITLGLESRAVDVNKGAVAVYLPKEQEHGLKCLTDISYWVLRETNR
jgi:quercetin dioxygenase-like cupin family protein